MKLSRRQLLYSAAIGSMSSQFDAGSALASVAATADDYRAIVCVHFQGGNDANNMLLATDAASWERYWSARWNGVSPIALMPLNAPPVTIGKKSAVTNRVVALNSFPERWGGVLPIRPRTQQNHTLADGSGSSSPRTFAVHPLLPNIKAMFDSGRLAFVANVGPLLKPTQKSDLQNQSNVPVQLGSHNDQTSVWQTGKIDGARNPGYGGMISDAFSSVNATSAKFTAVSTAEQSAFCSGKIVRQFNIGYQNGAASAKSIQLLNMSGMFNWSENFSNILNLAITDSNTSNFLAKDYVSQINHSIATSDQFNKAVSRVALPSPPVFIHPIKGVAAPNPLADQLRAVAMTIAARTNLTLKRQVFYVQHGSFDTHANQNNTHPVLMAQIDHAFSYFDSLIRTIGLDKSVTTFTTSEFGRSWTSNGEGTDHGWGGHHMIFGGAVVGGDIYGAFPTVGEDEQNKFSNPDMVRGSFIPAISVEQYLGPIAMWFGVTKENIAIILPNSGKFLNNPLADAFSA